jgi:hypothetical protein
MISLLKLEAKNITATASTVAAATGKSFFITAPFKHFSSTKICH